MGRHGGPGGDEDPSVDERLPGGRRRAPEPTSAPVDAPRPDDDELTTLGRRTRAERRREGSLPPGADPMSGRPLRAVRPTPPPAARPPAPTDTPTSAALQAPPPGRPPLQSGPGTSDLPVTVGPPTPTPASGRAARGAAPSQPTGPATEDRPAPEEPGRLPRPAAPTVQSSVVPPVVVPPRAAGGPTTGPQGGRAASRPERQAADAARRKEDRRRGVLPVPVPVEDAPRRGSRGLVIGLVAVVVIALVLLSVWSFTSPRTDAAAQSRSVAPTTAVSTQPSTSAPATTPAPADTSVVPAPTGPVFAPVSVLNSAGISGLAADVGDELVAGGWEIRTLGTYGSDDVATTTVFYTEGDATQQQAAESLVAQFPEVSGPAVRFFEIPDLPDPGIVVIADGSWRP